MNELFQKKSKQGWGGLKIYFFEKKTLVFLDLFDFFFLFNLFLETTILNNKAKVEVLTKPTCTNHLNLEMEPKYLTKSEVQLNPNKSKLRKQSPPLKKKKQTKQNKTKQNKK